MTDVLTPQQRSFNMSRIRSTETKMEIALRKALWREGFRYRKNPSSYFGKPDIVLKKYKTVIFLDSCFWHACRKHFRLPETNRDFWSTKIEKNKKRDKEVNEYYRKLGWSIIRIWEHEIKADMDKTVNKIVKVLAGRSTLRKE
jgi:DNA mismatch endonuclease, patch repair protein